MSVHYKPAGPHWPYHDLATKHRATVLSMGARWGFDDIDCDETAWRMSLKLCLGGKLDIGDVHLKNKYLTLCRYDFLNALDGRKRETAISKLRKPDDERSDSEILGSLSTFTPARQEEYTYLMQCIRALDELPKAHRRIMRKIAIGHSAIDIALAESRDIAEVLGEINVARNWVKDYVKYG